VPIRVLLHCVGGHFVDVTGSVAAELPATSDVLAKTPVSTAADVDATADAASAFESRRKTTPSKRQRAIRWITDALESRQGNTVL
jgi:acyl-CoA reductase-like NAD-dependent aldehyde dehydrogenase